MDPYQKAVQKLYAWVSQNELEDPEAVENLPAFTCENTFHTTKQPWEEKDARCPDCFSRWWAVPGFDDWGDQPVKYAVEAYLYPLVKEMV